MSKIKLIKSGVRKLLLSDEVYTTCKEQGERVLSSVGEHYEMQDKTYPERKGVVIRAADFEGVIDNSKNNTLWRNL